MDFITFCRAHGIVIASMPQVGVWKRYPTVDHPRKRNGAIKYMGTHAFVQNHALETTVSVWKSDDAQVDFAMVRRAAADAERRLKDRQEDAAQRAKAIVDRCAHGKHDYLVSKGFPDDHGLVWYRKEVELLVIPMWIGNRMMGVQLIQPDGEKRFLAGQRTAGATYTFRAGGVNVLCEGYATGLSVRAALKALRKPANVHVCFSAGNMAKVAATLRKGVIVADHDASGTGERVAKEIGWPYWMSDTQGEDANDYHRRAGLFRWSQALGRMFR